MKKSRILAIFLVICMMVAMTACTSTEDAKKEGGGETQQAESPDKKGKEPLKVAFVYNSLIGDAGWCYGHEQARKKVEEELDFVETTYMEDIAVGTQAQRVFSQLAEDGYDVIIPVTSAFEEDCRAIAPQYPDTWFLQNSGTYTAPNCESLMPDTTEVWWLLGKAAAMLTKTKKIGVVGGFTASIDMAITNAWLLGAQSVDPDITEHIIYINTYYDPAAERDAALSLADAGCDVLSQGTNTAAHVQVAVEKGLYAMSQYEDMSSYGPDVYVSGDDLNWAAYYIDTLTKIHEGTLVPQEPYASTNLWDKSCNYLPWGPMVTDEMKAELDKAYEELKADPDLIWKGPIYDNQGNLRVKEGEYLSDEDFISMDWWVKGVVTAGGE